MKPQEIIDLLRRARKATKHNPIYADLRSDIDAAIKRLQQETRELIEAREEIERIELQLAIAINQNTQAKALLQDRDSEIERLRAMLLRWVPRPSLQVYGFHKRDQPEECEKQLVRDACEIHGVPVPEHCQERKDGAK